MNKVRILMILCLLSITACTTENTPIIETSNDEVNKQYEYLNINESDQDSFELNLTVTIDVDNSWGTPDDNTLPPEEAALIGANYINDVLDINVNDMYVNMTYVNSPDSTRPYWSGSVFSSLEDRDLDQKSFTFSIDAQTGMRINLIVIHTEGYNLSEMTDKEIEDLLTYYQEKEYDEPDQTELELAYSQAKIYAQRHFEDTNIYEIQLDQAMPVTTDFSFIVINHTGRQAIVNLWREDLQLISIITDHNDRNMDVPEPQGNIG